MSAGWLSLIPARLIELPATGWELARAQRLSGVVMVADVCGFTAMSESVARGGPGATERLSRTINELFEPIVARVHEHGGEVALFVGDAVVAVLGDEDAALACAAAVHRAGSLELSVGLAAGELVSTVVGDPSLRIEHVLFGGALARAAAAERRAGPGRTVAGDLAPRGPAWPAPLRDAPAAPFLHPSVAARLEAGRELQLAEHRRVTSLFCRFEDLHEDDPAAPERLQAVVAAALEVLAQFGGALLQVETVDKGSTLKATFGAPVAHEDDERRAIACARALLERHELHRAAIGVATGTVYCGLIGSAARREYTVLGDAVNVAARLMLAARPGRILAAEATRERAGDWSFKEAGPLPLRGREGTVLAFEVGERRPAARRPRAPLVGRERELATALGLLERALAGEGTVLTITGEAGIGKSHLLDALVAAARERGVTVLRGGGQPFGRDFAYGAWRDAARELIPDPAERAELVAPLLGLAPGPSGLSPQLRAEALRELIVERLRRRAPLLLAVEDGQWLDGPSRALLARVARELPALRALLVVTVRSGESREPGLLPAGARLALGPLAPDALAQLVRAPPELASAIVERAGGNPLFASELSSLAHERGGGTLPDSLRAVVTARLDTLSEDERATLRIASVIGPRFAPEWLWSSDTRLGGPDAVTRTLAALARLDLVHRDGALHAFKHALTREVAYDTLALAAREDLHAAVARHIERTQDLDALEPLDLLAHHYAHSADERKQRVYLRRAADAARDAFSNDAAIRHYRALLALPAGEEALDATLELGGVLQLTGEWAQAEALYREALAGAGSERAAARARAALGGLLAFTGAYPDAVAVLEQADAGFAALGDDGQRLRVLERLAHTYFQQGDDERAGARAREQAQLARALGDRASESTAINTLALVLWHRGELEPARERLEAALAPAAEAGHRIGVVHLLNDLAGVLVALGRPAEALERLGEAYAQARAIGYRRFQGAAVGNAAQLLLEAGDDDPALACAGLSLDTAAALGDVLQGLHSATVIAVVAQRRGDARAAEALLERVVATARASDNRRYLASGRLYQARAQLALGRAADAAEAAGEALGIARAIGQAALAAEAEALIAGAPAPAPRAGAPLDAAPFLDEAPAGPDPAALVRRAEVVLEALIHVK